MLAATRALRRSSAGDVHNLAPRGETIMKAVAWLCEEIEESEPMELRLDARDNGKQSIAWAELFVHELSDHPTDKRLSD